jgi:pyruvate dehydrogenase E2 component (dihydrolipoamide acetyltransferase)
LDEAVRTGKPKPAPAAKPPRTGEPTPAAEAQAEEELQVAAEPGPAERTEAAVAPPPEVEPEPVIEFPAAAVPRKTESGPTVAASPSVRRLARELGIDIQQVTGSGPASRVSADDVKAHAKQLLLGRVTGTAAQAGGAMPQLPDFSQWGEIATEPLSNIRRATAKNLAAAWATIPHVTQFDRADVTQLESMRKRFNGREEARGRKLSTTAIVVKTVAMALRRYAKFNSSLDLMNDVIIYKKYCHVGVAVDTERGLLVPVIRDADRKSLVQVSAELADLAARARDKKLSPDQMQGASFTVSNLGGLGTTYFSPIVNWPQVSILGIGRAENQAVFDEGQFRPRLMMPLSISYDHRVIDGAEAARFLRWVAEALEQPLLMLLDD